MAIQVLPLGSNGSTLVLAMQDPDDVSTLEAIGFATGYEVAPVAASEDVLLRALEKHYPSMPASLREEADRLFHGSAAAGDEAFGGRDLCEELDLAELENATNSTSSIILSSLFSLFFLLEREWFSMPTKPTYKVPISDAAIGKRLQELRRARGLTQVELGKKLSMSQGLISGYERGRLRMNAGGVVAFAKALKVSTDELLGLKKTRQNGHFDRRFVKRLRKMSKLSRRDKEALVAMIDAFISKVPDDE